MKRVFALIVLMLLVATPAFAASVTVNWTPPTTNCDGSAIGDLAGYKIYFDIAPRPAGNVMPGTPSASSVPTCDTSGFTQYVYPYSEVVGNVTTHELQLGESENERTFYVTITALDNSGNESVYANEMSVVVPPLGLIPNPPVVITLTF